VSGRLASVGQILADGEVGLVGVDVAGVVAKVTILVEAYLKASLYFPALKF